MLPRKGGGVLSDEVDSGAVYRVMGESITGNTFVYE